MSTKLNILAVLSLNVLFVLTAPQQAPLKQVTEIPKDIPVCSEGNQNINECIRNSLQIVTSKAKNGIPELNIPPMDPLEIDKRSLTIASSILEGKIGLRNIKIYGLTDAIFDEVDFRKDGDHIKMVVKSRIPKLLIEGNYKAEIAVNEAKINSKGTFNLSMTDINIKAEAEAELYERDGHTYMRFVKYNIDPTLGDLHLHASGLVPDPMLNDSVLQFINENWRTVYKTILEETRPTWEPEFLKMNNEYYAHLPFDLLYTKE